MKSNKFDIPRKFLLFDKNEFNLPQRKKFTNFNEIFTLKIKLVGVLTSFVARFLH
jgi:hypothetical protein